MKRLLLLLAVALILASQVADAAPYKLIHAFKGTTKDGRFPGIGSSLVASGNILYGMTEDGGETGVFSFGVLFQVNSDGTDFKLIHTFNGFSELNPSGSKDDGALPYGTPVLDGSTLYGMTTQGGSNGYVGGTIFSVNTDGSGFRLLHNFGGLGDGWAPEGSLIISGSTLYGMTSSGGTNLGDDEGIIFSIQTDGTGYKVLHDFTVPGQGVPEGSLIISGTTLYGMTDGGSAGSGSIFLINNDGSDFLAFHQFTGTSTDGGNPRGSLIRQGSYLYGMTSTGGANGVGTVFQLYLFESQFHILHSFSTKEAFTPIGDLVASGGTLYGMTSAGVTNTHGVLGGFGSVFQIETNGDDYAVMHTFEFSLLNAPDGATPLGSPMLLGSQLFGMTSAGGSTTDGGTIFALTLPAGSGGGTGGGSGPPTISTTSPFPNGKVGMTYHEQLAATGGTAPYTWAVSAGHLPPGLTLSAAGVLGGKPTKGEVASFTIKVTGHDKETASQAFGLTVETPPTLVITSPKAAQKITMPTFNVTGTAADAVGGVAGVYYQLNGGPWTLAQSANNYENWTIANLPLPADADVLNAYAVDTFGNVSKTNTVKFTYYVTGELTVKTNGSGSFTPPDNGKNFQIGATLTITAKPAKGFMFLNWTNGSGTVLTNRSELKFVMSSNLVLTANFVPSGNLETAPSFEVPVSPFQETAGSYAGLFAPSGDSRENFNSGAVRLTVSATGLFSGKLTIGADSLPFAGSFDASGKASVSISGNIECADCPPARVLPGQQSVVLRKKVNMRATLQLDFAHQTVSGEVTDGAFVAQLAANRGAFSSGNSAGDFQGTYPLGIVSNGISSPVTSAFGMADVDESGNVMFSATIPKGTRTSQMSLLSRDGYFPLYLPLRDANSAVRGSLWAWVRISNGKLLSVPSATTLITDEGKSSAHIIGSSD